MGWGREGKDEEKGVQLRVLAQNLVFNTAHILDKTLTPAKRRSNSPILKIFPPDKPAEPKSNSELKNDWCQKNKNPQTADDDSSSWVFFQSEGKISPPSNFRESGASVITLSDSESESTNLQGDFSTKVSVKEIEVIEIDDNDEGEPLNGQKLQERASNVNDLTIIEENDVFVVANFKDRSLGANTHKQPSSTARGISILPKDDLTIVDEGDAFVVVNFAKMGLAKCKGPARNVNDLTILEEGDLFVVANFAEKNLATTTISSASSDREMSVLPKASTSSSKASCIKKSSEQDKNATPNQQYPATSKDISQFQKPSELSKKTNLTQNPPIASTSTSQTQYLSYNSLNASCSAYLQHYSQTVQTSLANIQIPRPYERAYQLEWGYRSMLLAREFGMIAADIFCLQEVEQSHLYSFYVPVFSKLGYSGLYKKRTRDMVDGCAIFYKSNMKLLSNQPIEYFFGADTVLDRDNVAQIARFEDVHSGRQICVANTHLLFNMKRGDVKLAQLAVLLANLDKECGPESGRSCPYVICGDFNMKPNCKIYEFIRSGQMSFKNARRGTISTSEDNFTQGPLLYPGFMPSETNIGRDCRFVNKKGSLVDDVFEVSMLLTRTVSLKLHLEGNGTNVKGHDNYWTHPLKLGSVYDHVAIDSQEPEVSAYSYEGTSNPDFMFYSVKKRNLKEGPLHLVRRLSLPAASALYSTLGPWPNEITPSDHIPLVAEFHLL
ncbi:unnamed protein product [Anisakis simplex]|uniref:Endo/exonuclease/phosphatase domain-containing protein n=1 Tax=Anisakis simplex TaxID=6269 RepID=A0A0M3K3G2_ANISI|nr:unnamed protein product [Anisakis simplex]